MGVTGTRSGTGRGRTRDEGHTGGVKREERKRTTDCDEWPEVEETKKEVGVGLTGRPVQYGTCRTHYSYRRDQTPLSTMESTTESRSRHSVRDPNGTGVYMKQL